MKHRIIIIWDDQTHETQLEGEVDNSVLFGGMLMDALLVCFMMKQAKGKVEAEAKRILEVPPGMKLPGT